MIAGYEKPAYALVSTDRFWSLMCLPEFIRTDRNHGKVNGANYYVITAPEDRPGFMEKEISKALHLIGAQRKVSVWRVIYEVVLLKFKNN